jgi:UDP-N-acetylmuramoyl-tripeptide--D-alanyl-D-alanine ligase
MQIENWRSIGIINDTYNANPASMNAALETLAEIKCRGDKIAVLGDMFELGKHSAKEHRWLGQRVAKAGIDVLYLLGDRSAQVRNGALRGGMRQEQIVIGRDHADMARRLRDRVKQGDWLLFKGSRGMRMEKVLQELKGGNA